MSSEVKLVDFWASPFVMRVKIALKEKGISDYETIEEENLINKSSLLLEMNPVHKKIPVLIHKGRPVCESLIIIEYIDEVWNDKPPILPSDPYERSHARFWADYVDMKIYSSLRPMLLAQKGTEVQEAAKKELIEGCKQLEAELGDKTYFGGDKFGLVDIAVIPLNSWFYAIETLIGNFDTLHECPKLVAWAKRCMEMESVSTSLPDKYKVYEFALEMRKMLEID